MKISLLSPAFFVATMVSLPVLSAGTAGQTPVFDQPQCAGMSGFRAHWDQPISVAEDGQRVVVDSQVKDRGQTAVWGGEHAGPLAFDAVHRQLLVRFPGAAEKIAVALASGKVIEKVELVLPYLDEEIWPQGRVDFPSADGYRYRMNWDCDKLYRNNRPSWHAVAHALRKPWQADAEVGPTYNAAVNGAVYWKRFGASDTTEDRFATQLGPAEVSSYKPAGRMDVTEVLTDATYGNTTAERLRVLADYGFVVSKLEVYDARFYNGSYEFTVSGQDPYAYAKTKDLWQDTTLTQTGRARLEKNGAVIEREKSWANMFLRTFPKQNRYVAMNLLPNYLTYSFREPGGVRIVADGACSMGRWAVKDSREIDIRYHAFGGEYLPKEKETAPATLLFITGAKGKPQVTLNQQDVTGALKPWRQDGVDGWLVSLTGTFLKDETITARLAQ